MDNKRAVKKKNKPKVKIYTKNNNKSFEKDIITDLQNKYESIDVNSVSKFIDLPLSTNTLKGLKNSNYVQPTEIQRETILLALQGKDILGAAQTGSGKTLAFLIPILEVLYCKQWTHLDGTGALVITPTRELAYQIFETLRKVGRYHDFSAGLIIGGKDLKFERKRMDQCNIIICTPGRLLQHMDENPLFDCANMQILVLDEADRCLDMGFEQTMNAIIANLPPKRQTLLFSATQTKSVKDLARLSLKNACYVAVHENAKYSTPSGLEQSYLMCELHEKVSVIWSFIKNHLKQKCIIFLSSCKQVKYIYEIFCKLRPGMTTLALYGSLHQMRRMSIYEKFCRKTSAVLFATDLAARGLDFPKVHWVVQADCPEDTDTYIHRVGRTARYQSGGNSLLILLPSEENIIKRLDERKIPINKIDVNPSKMQNPVRKMEAFLASNPVLKDSAQRAFVAYVKSVFLMKDKLIFDVHALETDLFAKSLGLAIPPRIRFLQRLNAKKQNKVGNDVKSQPSSANKVYFASDDEYEARNSEESSEADASDNDKVDFRSSTSNTETSHPFHVSDDSDEDNALLKVKRKDHDIELPSQEELEMLNNRSNKKKVLTKVAMAKKMLRKKIAPNKKIIFNEDGDTIKVGTKEKQSTVALEYENENEAGIDFEKARMVLKEEDKFDKQLFREKVKLKHKEKKMKLKQKKQKDQEEKDEFGSESEGDEPDLSWLPDPEKIYGKTSESNAESPEVEKDISINKTNYRDNHIKQQKAEKKRSKRKLQTPEAPTGVKKKKRRPLEASALSINEAEELALMLLKNK